jgi:DNA-directed RNA polymerase subunit RPC12/RpoP
VTSTSNPPIALAISLIIVFVVLFALSIYWLLFRKGRPILPRPIRPRAAAWPPHPHASEDEWEAAAPYPEHAMRVVQQAHPANQARHAAPADTRQPNHDAHDNWAHWDETPPCTPPSHGTRAPDPDDAHLAQDLHDAWESLQEAVEPKPSVSPSPPSSALTPTAPVRCPRCLSSRIDTRNLARKAGSTIGSVAGATGGMAAALAGAETGAVVGSIGGPLGTVFGGLAGAVIAGLAGSAAGCAAGSVVGSAIDENILSNYVCLQCQHLFSAVQD